MLCQCFSSPCSCIALKAAQRAQRRANRDENKRERKRLRKALVDDGPKRDDAAPRDATHDAAPRASADDAAAPRAPSPEAALPAAAPPADARSSGASRDDEDEDSPPAVFNAPVSQTQASRGILTARSQLSSQALPSQFGPTPPLSGPLRDAPWDDALRSRAQSLRAVDADDPFARYLVSLHGEIAARPTMRLDDAGDPAIRAPLTRFHEDDRGAHRGADESSGYMYP
ncbi:patatin-like phospholipase [Aureococcus anophagefferens]|nr:patatin-like phospholipase [Aureococcus anophagefferens]